MLKGYQFLRSIELNKNSIRSFNTYPFCLPAVKTLSNLELHPKVTFIVGENGTGKSTILEAIAASYGFNPEGGTINFNFSSKATHSELYNYIKLIRGVVRPKDGFFLRAESFYNVATNVDELNKEDMNRGGRQLYSSYGGISLHNQSHGESFFSLIMNRFGSDGLYILDEPEAALSPARQMAMVSRIHYLVQKRCQFIIATHSPIIMSYPDSTIYEIKDYIRKVNYKDTENYQVMKTFVNNTDKMLDILMNTELD